MALQDLTFNNFTKGQIDHDMNGRFDLPILSKGFAFCKNFISNYRGNLKNRTGFEKILYDLGEEAVLVEFKYNSNQSYLLVFTNLEVAFYSYDSNGNFGPVLSGSTPLVLTTTITLAQAKKMSWAQSGNAMYIAENTMYPKLLLRTAAAAFTFGNATATGSGFDDPSTGTIGYPACVAFHQSRLIYASTSLYPTRVWCSKVGDPATFTLTTSNIVDTDPCRATPTEFSCPILWLFSKEDLYLGTSEGIANFNGDGTKGSTITPTAMSIHLSARESASTAKPCLKDSLTVYGSYDGRIAYVFDYDLVTEKFKAQNLNFISYDSTKNGITRIEAKRDVNNLIYMLKGDGSIIAMLFNKDENIIGWYPIESDGEFLSITSFIRPDGQQDLFTITKRTINSSTVYSLERMADEVEFMDWEKFPLRLIDDDRKTYYSRYIAEQLKQCNYLDNSTTISNYNTDAIVFNGTDTITRAAGGFTANDVGHKIVYQTSTGVEYGTFLIKTYVSANQVTVECENEGALPSVNTYSQWYLTMNEITDISDYEGETLTVVGNGGYIGDFTVTDGAISLDREYSTLCYGYSYLPIAKMFSFGSISDTGINSQTSPKNITLAVARFVNSMGVQIGTDLSKLEDIQKFDPNGSYDSPPLPMNSDQYINIPDISEKEKNFYIVQPYPLPMALTMLILKTEFSGA